MALLGGILGQKQWETIIGEQALEPPTNTTLSVTLKYKFNSYNYIFDICSLNLYYLISMIKKHKTVI